jgi:hypothetical protein
VEGGDTNVGLTLDGKGSGVVTSTPLLVATAGVKLGNNLIYASDGGTAITLDTSDNVAITGDLTVTGNDIKSSAATAITLSSDDVTVVGDLTVTGTSSGTMTLGADADGTDRSLVFGHSTLKSIVGIDDDQDVFAINTDAAFEANNDIEIDASGNVTVNNGSIQCSTIDYKDGDLAMTIADGGGVTFDEGVTIADNLIVTGTDAAANTFANASTFNGLLTANSFIATAVAKGLQYGPASTGGLTASLQTTGTIAIADDSVQVGKFCTVSADAQTLTLPAVVVGASFIIVNIAADGAALLTISPDSGDKFLVDIAGAAGTDNKDIINTKATQKQYDYVHLVGMTGDGWLIADKRGVWVDQA